MKVLLVISGLLCLTQAVACQEAQPDVLREFPPPRPITALPDRNQVATYEPTTDSYITVRACLSKTCTHLRIPVAGGSLRLYPEHLSASRGEIWLRLDQAGPSPETEASGEAAWATAAMLNALGELAGNHVKRSSEVRIRLERLLSPSSESATQAKPVKRNKRRSAKGRRTEVRALARAHLTLNGVRTEENVPVLMEFQYLSAGVEVGEGAHLLPDRFSMHARKPYRLDLTAHDLSLLARTPATQENDDSLTYSKLGSNASVRLELDWQRQTVAFAP